MSYTRPDPDDVRFWADGKAFTRPAPDAVAFTYEASGIVYVPIACGAPEVVSTVTPAAIVSASIACGEPQVAGNVGAAGRILVDSALSAPTIVALSRWAAISAPIACGDPSVWGTSSFDGLIPPSAQLSYLMDVITPSGAVRVPVSSWQSSLQTDGDSYVQCVIPNVEPWLATLDAGTEFVIYRRARWSTYEVFSEMARAPLDTVRTDRGATNYTGTIQGYADPFPAIDSQAAGFTRALQSVRTISSTEGGTRMRAAIDWGLFPGMKASYGNVQFTVSYVNQYVTDGDEYMDVGGDI